MYALAANALLGLSMIHGAFALPASAAASGIIANPTNIPLLQDDQVIKSLQILAQGTLPNGPPPPKGAISPEGITNLQLIQLNEFFEASFFSSLLNNITSNVPGFEIHDKDEKVYIEDALVAIVAQETLHAVGADRNLESQGATRIQPCTYKYPSTSFLEAITFAQTFTELVMGTLQDVSQIFAVNRDTGPVRLVASVIGQEGQQDGFFRLTQNKNKVPSQLPFLSTSTRDFAFSALQQNVIVSCPNDDVLKSKLKLFGTLNLLTKTVEPKDQVLQFSFDLTSLTKSNIITKDSFWSAYGEWYSATYDWASKTSIVFLNQQNVPVVAKLENIEVAGTLVKFNAKFPYAATLMNGLTIGAVVKGQGPFANAAAVANSTIFAPALIVIN